RNEPANKLDIDPVEFRLMNEPQVDESTGLPFSSRHLVECLKTGAGKFGWAQRTPQVGSMKRDGLTLGWDGARGVRHAGYRYRYLHDPRATGRVANGIAARSHRRRTRRYDAAAWAGL